MIDFNNLIYGWLNDVVPVMPDYPQSDADMPACVITKTADIEGEVYEGVEMTTIINYQIVVVANTISERDLICSQVKKIMGEHYWRRISSYDVNQPGEPPRNIAIYSVEVNN